MIRLLGLRTLLLFIIGFIISLPFNYTFIPETGNWLKPILESVAQNIFNKTDLVFYSDSIVMRYWLISLLLISLIIALIWTLIRTKESLLLHFWIDRFATYYLALILLIYGFNKIFLYQFYIPEPNTLYTPLGQLSPDILYWSSMGSSPTYSIFAGLIELLPACLLLFRKTKMLGAFIAFAVLTNVVFINWGFDITVKIFSFFLLLLSLIVLFPYLNRLQSAFFGSGSISTPLKIHTPQHPIYFKFYRILKIILIVFLLLEALAPYLKSGQFNGNNQPKSTLFGAYAVSSNPNQVKRVFFHSSAYFIIQTYSDEFFDYPIQWNGNKIELSNYENETSILALKTFNDSTYALSGNFYGTAVSWQMKRLKLDSLPFFQ